MRGAERDELIRSQLVPLTPGERPPIVVTCAVLCGLIAVGNLVLWAAGWKVRGQELNAAGAFAPALLFAIVGVGLWRTRLLAIAAMQVLLGLTALFATGALLVAADVPSALLGVLIIAVCTALFWPLIRINARAGARDRLNRIDHHG